MAGNDNLGKVYNHTLIRCCIVHVNNDWLRVQTLVQGDARHTDGGGTHDFLLVGMCRGENEN